LVDHKDQLVNRVHLVIQDHLDHREKLEQLVPWESEVHLELRVCKVSLDPQEYLAFLE